MMKIVELIKALFTTKLESTKSIVEIIAIIFAGIFSVIQWGIPAYWDRQENYLLWFKSFDKDGNIIINETIKGGFCNLQGTVTFSNYSKSPIDIIDTKIEIVPFETKKSCDEDSEKKCFVSYSGADVYERLCPNRKCKDPYVVNIPPLIWEQPLYGKNDATRPFNVSIPKSVFKKNSGILVVATQEIGRGCIDDKNPHRKLLDIFSGCKPTRALVVDADACQTGN